MKIFFLLFFIFAVQFANCTVNGLNADRTLTTEYTFIRHIPARGRVPSRMKVRQDPPAHPGYNGKQGGERFRTILKYPIATDMAMNMKILFGISSSKTQTL